MNGLGSGNIRRLWGEFYRELEADSTERVNEHELHMV